MHLLLSMLRCLLLPAAACVLASCSCARACTAAPPEAGCHGAARACLPLAGARKSREKGLVGCCLALLRTVLVYIVVRYMHTIQQQAEPPRRWTDRQTASAGKSNPNNNVNSLTKYNNYHIVPYHTILHTAHAPKRLHTVDIRSKNERPIHHHGVRMNICRV